MAISFSTRTRMERQRVASRRELWTRRRKWHSRLLPPLNRLIVGPLLHAACESHLQVHAVLRLGQAPTSETFTYWWINRNTILNFLVANVLSQYQIPWITKGSEIINTKPSRSGRCRWSTVNKTREIRSIESWVSWVARSGKCRWSTLNKTRGIRSIESRVSLVDRCPLQTRGRTNLVIANCGS